MKNIKIYTILLALLVSGISLNGQKDIVLQINHFLGETPFGFNIKSENNMEHNFNVSRIQYYLSEISVVHDGGQETMINDLWVLVDGGAATIINLGNVAADEIEGISFHVGVDKDHNHLDPASWPSDHPLYPKFPSMHWGWSAGYRFIAMEGKSGTNMDQTYQLHGLGDGNYFKTTVMNTAVEVDGFHFIYIDADYNKVLRDISLNSGVISHGEIGDAKKSLENCRDHVFSAGSAPSGIFESKPVAGLTISPNPSMGLSQLRSELLLKGGQIQITDLSGKLIQIIQVPEGALSVDIDLQRNKGIYVVSFIHEDGLVARERVVKF